MIDDYLTKGVVAEKTSCAEIISVIPDKQFFS